MTSSSVKRQRSFMDRRTLKGQSKKLANHENPDEQVCMNVLSQLESK